MVKKLLIMAPTMMKMKKTKKILKKYDEIIVFVLLVRTVRVAVLPKVVEVAVAAAVIIVPL